MAFAWAGFALNVRSMNFTVCAPERAGARQRQDVPFCLLQREPAGLAAPPRKAERAGIRAAPAGLQIRNAPAQVLQIRRHIRAGRRALFHAGRGEKAPGAQPRDGRRRLLRLPPGGQRRQQHGHAAFALAGEDIIHLRVFRQNLPRVVAHLRAAQHYICARPRSLYSGGKTQRFPNVPQIARKQHRIRLPVQNAGQHVPLRLIDGALPHLGTNTRRACGLHTRQQAPGRQRRMNVFRIECKQHRLHRPRPPLSPFLRLQIKNAASRAR